MQNEDKSDFQLETEARIAQFEAQREVRPAIQDEEVSGAPIKDLAAPAHLQPRRDSANE